MPSFSASCRAPCAAKFFMLAESRWDQLETVFATRSPSLSEPLRVRHLNDDAGGCGRIDLKLAGAAFVVQEVPDLLSGGLAAPARPHAAQRACVGHGDGALPRGRHIARHVEEHARAAGQLLARALSAGEVFGRFVDVGPQPVRLQAPVGQPHGQLIAFPIHRVRILQDGARAVEYVGYLHRNSLRYACAAWQSSGRLRRPGPRMLAGTP